MKDMSSQQRLVLVISILASLIAFLDGSVINVALPAITDELGGGLTLQQWVVDAYLLTLGSLILIAGSLSDLFGREKVLAGGLIGFGIASILCAVSPTGGMLIASRALLGVAGAMLVPSSLAMIISAFSGRAQGRAIGTWTAWTGMAFVIGPLLGGLLVDAGSWRWIFAINIIPIAVTLLLMRKLEEEAETRESSTVDVKGSVLAVIGLGGTVFALIEQSKYGWSDPFILVPLLVGILGLVLFYFHEKHIKHPMLPLGLFKSRNFSVGNLATLAIYGALSVATFLISIFVQQVGGFSAFQAGMALLPVVLIMFVLSPRFGDLAGKYGPRLFMGLGPIVGSVGFLLMLFAEVNVNYWTQLFPGIVLFGIGLSITVAPLTSAVLGAIEKRQAGIASAVNNAISRIASLLAVASIGAVTGTVLDLAGFKRSILLSAIMLALGGIISATGISNRGIKMSDS